MSDVYQKAIDAFGVAEQLKQAQEEMAELIVAISHVNRRRQNSWKNFVEELADVVIMVEQLKLLTTGNELQAQIELKQSRLEQKIKEHKWSKKWEQKPC